MSPLHGAWMICELGLLIFYLLNAGDYMNVQRNRMRKSVQDLIEA